MPFAEDRQTIREAAIRSSAAGDLPRPPAKSVSVCLVGGKSLFRSAIRHLLDSAEIAVAGAFDDEEAFAAAAGAGRDDGFDLILMILGAGAARSLHRIGELLARRPTRPPLVVLTDQLSRDAVYGALRMGAKAYVSLDSQPEELRRAILLAAEGKMHLSRDAAEIMINDITAGARSRRGSGGPPGPQLSARETEIVRLLCDGLSSRRIAQRLQVAPKTVENHRYNIYRKCNVEGIAGLIRFAVQQGIVSL
jgi:two-component system NarL family response regulator